MAIELRWLRAKDSDLAEIAAQLNGADSEVSIKQFSAESLRRFLSDPLRYYLIATVDGKLAGALHGYVHLHPTGVSYAYIDEVDTIEEYRRQGVATAMMREALAVAKQQGASEVWLGTEHDNEAAKALYQSLSPTEIEHGPIFSYKIN
jgi:ribosomal protein S18 acetylase RimI-like enzyme